MITIKKHASTVLTGLVGSQPVTPSLPPSLARLMQETAPMVTPTKKCKHVIAIDVALSAGMRRIWDQYRAGKYSASDYSVRTAQRHRKFFLSMGFDLRVPYSTLALTRLPVSEQPAKQRAISAKNKKKVVKPLPASEPEPPSIEPNSHKSVCASNALSRAYRAGLQQRRSSGTTGLGALARRAR